MSWQPSSNDSDFKPPWMEVTPPDQNPVGNQPQPFPIPEPTQPQIGLPEQTNQADSTQGAGILPPQVSSSPFKIIIPVLGIGIMILLIVFVIKTILPKNETESKQTTSGGGNQIVLTYWGLWEPEQVMAPILSEYKKSNPKVTINYIFQSPKDYRERLQSALATGKGPDIFRLHNTWLPMFKNQLSSVPANLVNFNDYYPVVGDFKADNKYYGVPLEFDALALYYNVDLFAAAGKQPPTTWKELREAALALRAPQTGKIQTAGVALGTTNNIDNWSDILALMMLQNGADLTQPNSKLAEDAIKFYTLFTTVDKVWDETLPSSVYAFAAGKVAMIFAPSWRAFDIKEINPQLSFRTVPVPQLGDTRVAWANFWVESVSKTSSNQQAAWNFLKYLSDKDTLKKLYTYESQVRLFGEPYPLKSLASQLEQDPVAGAFVKQGSYAKSWYLCSRTQDNGINDRMSKYFEDAVNGVLEGKNITEVLAQTQTGVTQVLKQYQISPKTLP